MRYCLILVHSPETDDHNTIPLVQRIRKNSWLNLSIHYQPKAPMLTRGLRSVSKIAKTTLDTTILSPY